MKQNITLEEFNQLPEEKRDKLSTWMVNRRYPKEMTIGQMIEFLDDYHKDFWIDKLFYAYYVNCECDEPHDLAVEKDYKQELCDALWELVKKTL